MKSFISASVVLYDGSEKYLTNLLTSLSKLPNVDIFVVDNTGGRFKDLFDDLHRYNYLNAGKNLGYGAGHNVALKEVMKDGYLYHAVLNPDVWFDPEAFWALVDFIDKHKEASLVAPKVFYPDGRLQYTCRLLPTPFNLFVRRFAGVDWKSDLYELRFTGYSRIMKVPFIMGCFWLLRLDFLRSVGLFDERFFLYMEDVDLCRRLFRVSDVLFFPHVSIYHVHMRGSYKRKDLLIHHIKSAISYFNKWGWVFDEERDKVNKSVLRDLGYA